MQLAQVNAELESLGIKVAVMTYDPVATLKTFSDQHRIPFVLLQDEAQKHVLAYGILNEEFAPGDRAFGVPHPGMLWLDNQGVVIKKFAVPGYRDRPLLDEVLTAVRSTSPTPSAPASATP